MLKITVKREKVTIDDRRAVIVLARSRKPADIAKVPQEAFLRQQLKARMGIAKDEPASESIKEAAKQMAAALAPAATPAKEEAPAA